MNRSLVFFLAGLATAVIASKLVVRWAKAQQAAALSSPLVGGELSP